jgi:hypothetical protein
MARNKPGVSGDPMNPRQRGTFKQEAIRFLENNCRLYLKDRASDKDIDDAIAIWNALKEQKPR